MFASQKKVSLESPSSIIYERKFDTALRLSHLQQFITKKNECSNDLDIILITNSNFIDDQEQYILTPEAYATLLKIIITKTDCGERISNFSIPLVVNSYRLSKANIDFQLNYMLSQNYLPNKMGLYNKFKIFMEACTPTTLIKNLIDFASWLSDTIEKSNLLHSRKFRSLDGLDKFKELISINHRLYDPLQLKIVWSFSYALIQIGESIPFLVSKPYLLLMHNKCCDLISVLLYTQMARGNALQLDCDIITKKFVLELCKIVIKYKNKGTSILKELEGLCIAETLVNIEQWDNTEFLNTLIVDLKKNTKFQYAGSSLQVLFLASDIPLRHELACLSKIIAHPYVDMLEGSIHLHKTTTEVYDINVNLLFKTICHAKQAYIRNHIVKYNKWPPCEINSHIVPKALRMAFILQKDPYSYEIVNNYGRISVDDFRYIDLLKNLRYSKIENIIPYLKDKTISVLETRVMSNILNKTKEDEGDPIKWTETRLLLLYLINPKLICDHETYVKKYSNAGSLEELRNYLVIRIVPKEKEMKIKFRGFGCHGFEERLRCLEQEKNAANYLELFSDHQAMTLGELDIARKLYSFRRLKIAYPNHIIINCILDASNWNHSFRDELVRPVMKETLDKIYDTNVFSKTQEKYNHTLFYVPDHEECYSWKGQGGGIEGLNQYTWDIIYDAVLQASLPDDRIKTHALFKGDDYRFAIIIPKALIEETDIHTYKNKIITAIATNAKKAGFTIKVSDSYGSERYFAFSKIASIDTIELPQVFRKIQKCYGANNAFLPFMDDFIGSTYSNAHSACKVGPTVISCYFVALFWSYYYIFRSDYYKKTPEHALVSILLVPSNLGGYPIIYLHNMFVRAESDLLSPFFGMLEYARICYPHYYEYMIKFCITHPTIPITYIALYKDPYSIPNVRPSLPNALLRQEILPALASKTTNKSIKELIKAAKSKETELAIHILDTANVLAVRVLSVIYACLPSGILDELLRKFETSRSVVELLIVSRGKRNADRILRSVVRREFRLQNWRVHILNGTSKIPARSLTSCIVECPTETAYNVRKFAWGKAVEGVTMPPLQHQTILTTRLFAAHDDYSSKNHYTYTRMPLKQYLTPDKREHYASAHVRPFIGYTTRSGNSEPVLNFVDKDVLLTKLKNITDLASWTDVSGDVLQDDGSYIKVTSNLIQLLDKMTRLYTDEPLDKLAPFAGKRKAGSITHHMRSPGFRESIVPNTLSNIYQQIKGETNSHVTFRLSPSKYLVNFLHTFCYIVSNIYLELEFSQYSSSPQEIWVVTKDCEFCMKPILETPITINTQLLQDLYFNSIKATKLGITATNIIKESLLLSDTVYNIEGHLLELSPIEATLGIFIGLYQSTSLRTKMIQERYEVPMLTGERKSVLSNLLPRTSSKDIGQTEIKRASLPTLVDAFIMLVFYAITAILPKRDNVNIAGTIGQLPSTEFYWLPILQEIYKTGKLQLFMGLLAKKARAPLTLHWDNPETCIIQSTLFALESLKYDTYIHPLVLVTNSDFIQTKSWVSLYMANYLWKKLTQRYHFLPKITHDKELYNTAASELVFTLLLGPWKKENIILPEQTTVDHVYTLEHFCIIDEEIIGYENMFDLADFVEILEGYGIALLNRLQLPLKKAHELYLNSADDIRYTAYDTLRLMPIEAKWTTLSDCINTLRSIEAEIPNPRIDLLISHTNKDFRMVPSDSNNTRICRLVTTRKPEILSTWLLPCHDQVTFGNMLNTREICINEQYLHRPLGYSNSSPNNLIDIWNEFKIPIFEIRYLNIMCFGDGRGSIAALMAELYPNSTIMFNTLLRDYIEQPPIAALNIAERNNSVIIYEHLASSYDNLAESTVIDYYIKNFTNPTIIISEAEIPPEDHMTQVRVAFNLIRYYLHNRTQNTILILKISMSTSYAFNMALSILSRTSLFLYVYKALPMRCVPIVHIICWGVLEDQKISNDSIIEWTNTPISSIVAIKCRKFIDDLLKTEEKRLDRADINLRKPSPNWSSWINMLELHWINILAIRYNIIVNYDQTFAQFKNYSYDVYMTPIIQSMTNASIVIKDSLNEGGIIHRHQSWNPNTQTHRIILINKYLSILGWLYVVKKYANCNTKDCYIFDKDIKSYFVAEILKLDDRDMPLGIKDKLFTKQHIVNEVRFNYYKSFIDGCQNGCITIAAEKMLKS